MKAIAKSRPQKTVSTRLTRNIQSPELKHNELVMVSSRFTSIAGGGFGVTPVGFRQEDENNPEESRELGLMVSDWFSAFSAVTAVTTLILDDPDRKLLLCEQNKNKKNQSLTTVKNQTLKRETDE